MQELIKRRDGLNTEIREYRKRIKRHRTMDERGELD
jgi:hypothetical protein